MNTDFLIEDSYEDQNKALIEETDEVLTDNNEIMDEEQLETLERLKEIG